MSQNAAISAQDMNVLSRIMFQGYAGNFVAPVSGLRPLAGEFEYVAALDAAGRSEFLRAAEISRGEYSFPYSSLRLTGCGPSSVFEAC